MQVEVPITLTTSPRRMLAPMASQCASKAPVGMGMPARGRASPPTAGLRDGRRSCRRWRSARAILSRTPASSGSTAVRNSSGGRPPQSGFHIHLWPMAQMLRGNSVGVGDAAESGGDHVAVFERGDEFGAQLGVVAEPVQQLGPAPLRGVDAAAPVDSFEAGAAVEGVGGAGDLRCLAGRAVVAPEIVFAQRDEAFADHDDAGAGGVERDGFDLVAIDAADAHRLVHGASERGHLVVVRLRLEVRVGGGVVQRILGAAAPSLPRSLSKMEMRTLSVPKSTPATTLTVLSCTLSQRRNSAMPGRLPYISTPTR
jgi:hypothetical protein